MTDSDSSDDDFTIYNEWDDPDYNPCFTSGIPLSVFRLIYGLQFSTLNKRIDNGNMCTVTFDLSPIFIDNLMETMIWETNTKTCTIHRTGDIITITIPNTSLILQGLDHNNPRFPKEIWHYLDTRAKKENIDIKIGK